jgi:hypothetical protein
MTRYIARASLAMGAIIASICCSGASPAFAAGDEHGAPDSSVESPQPEPAERGAQPYQLDHDGGIHPDGSVRAPVGGGVSCLLDTQNVYLRASGGVGGHPRTTCTAPVTSIRQSVDIYKSVWWGWQHVGGPFTGQNFGQRSYEQRNASVGCADSRDTTFRMEVHGTVTYLDKSYVASAYEEATLPCGTNP